MARFIQRTLKLGTASLLLTCAAFAQSPPTAYISGRVLSEDGRTLNATVSLSFASPQGYPAPPHRVLTGTNGTFSFSHLPAGRYTLCAQVAPSETAPANSPYVDTCVWPSVQTPITVAAGQQVGGIVFTAPKGALLKVQLTDPDRVLPQATAKGFAPLEPEAQVILQGPDGLYRHARLVSNDIGGRSYQIAIPLKTAVTVNIASNTANVFDHAGKQIQEKDEVSLKAANPMDVDSLNFTVRRK